MFEEEEVTIYEPVKPASEREKCLQLAVARKEQVVLKNAMDRELHLVAESLDVDGSLRARFATPGPIPFKPGDHLRARFNIGSGEFFFECRPRFSGQAAILTLDGELLQLQKRKTFRLVLPDEYPAFYQIVTRFSGPVPLQCQVVDVSDVGVGFRTDIGEPFGIGEKIEGELTLGAHKPVRLGGWIRFLSKSNGTLQVGLEIDHALAQTAADLQEAILHFRRDVFNQKNSR